MALHFGDEASETVRFIEMFDKFFDAVNVSNFNSGKHSRKCFKDPYRSSWHRFQNEGKLCTNTGYVYSCSIQL